jgi:hypothetical protein
MRKVFYIFTIFTLLISFSSAIKISPSQQRLNIEQYETNCANIWVLPKLNYSITSKWSFDGKGDLNKYHLSVEEIKLNINYSYISNGKYEFCFTPRKGGNLSGIIYFYSEEDMVEIGTWIDLTVPEKDFGEKITLLTGNVAKDIKEKSSELKNEILAGSLIFLIGFLGVLIFVKRK